MHELEYFRSRGELVLEILEADVCGIRIDVDPLGSQAVREYWPIGGRARQRGGENLVTRC